MELAQNLAYRNMSITDFIQRLRKCRICGMDVSLIVLAKMWGVTIGVVTDHELWLSDDVECADQVQILLGTQTAMTFYSIGTICTLFQLSTACAFVYFISHSSYRSLTIFTFVVGCAPVDLTHLEVLQHSPNSERELKPNRLGLRKKTSTVSVPPSTLPHPSEADLAIAQFEKAMTSTPKSSPNHPHQGTPNSSNGNLLPEDNFDPSTAILPLHSSSASSDDESDMLHRPNMFDSSNEELENVMHTEDSEATSSPIFGKHQNNTSSSQKVNIII